MNRLLHVLSTISLCVVLGAVSAANPSEAGGAAAHVAVSLGPQGLLMENGWVTVAVEVTCPSGWDVLEAFVYITQDGNTSIFASIPVVCDNGPHRYLVDVPPFPGTPFHGGDANATAHVELTNDTGGSQSGGDTGPLRIRR